MDATVFISREFHQFFRELGKHSCIKYGATSVIDGGKHATDVSVNWDLIYEICGKQPAELQPFITGFINVLCNRGDAYVIEILGKMLANGPKMFQPTLHQAEAMLNCSVNLNLSEYQQPFPVTIIKMPREMVEKGEIDPFVAVYHDTNSNTLSILCDNVLNGDEVGVVHSSFMSAKDKDIESILTTVAYDQLNGSNEDNWKRKQRSERLAINCCLLLTQYKTRVAPIDPSYFEKLKKQSKSPNAEKRKRAITFLIGEFEQITFEQEINFYDTEVNVRSQYEPTGGSVSPHWRRGHWRRQAYGTGNTLRKPLFIKPILVRKDIFMGDIADTSVTYRGK